MVYALRTMDLTPKQQTSEAIRQAENILIITGQRPSVDQTVSVLALTMILRKFGKQATAVVTDQLPAAVAPLANGVIDKNLGGVRDFILKLDTSKAEVDKLRYEMVDGKLNVVITPFKGNFAPSDVTFGYGESAAGGYDVIVVIGVPGKARIDKIYDQNAQLLAQVPVINFDFHRSNEGYGAINMIDGNASSLSEMLIALSESLQSGLIDAGIATPLLMGIVSATDRFTATHTTSKSLTVAAQMMAAGASQPQVIRALYRGGDGSRDAAREPNRDSNRPPASRDGGNRDRTERPARVERTERTERPERTEQPRAEQSRAEQPRREQPAAPAAQPTQQTQPTQPVQSARQLDNDMNEPIISPAHIEFSPDPADDPRVQMPPEPIQVAPGQLPLEMSPLVSQAVQNPASTQQAPHQSVAQPAVSAAPMPSSFQND